MAVALVAVVASGVFFVGDRIIKGAAPKAASCLLQGKQYSNGSTATIEGKSMVCIGGKWSLSAATVQSKE